MKKILEVRGVKKSFGNKVVLDDINFDLNAGEILGIVGRSGCGKSTLVKIISQMLKCDGGRIFFCDQDITNFGGNLKKIYKNMQMIFQMPEDSFDPRKTLGWSIAEPLKNFGFDNISNRVENLLTEVGLDKSFADRYPHEVSGGQCQRAAIARAISISPQLLICDEATSALDVTVQAQIIQLLRCLCIDKKISMLFITHDLAILPNFADRIIVMNSGRIIEEGEPDKVIKNPKSDFTRELLSTDFFTMKGEI